MENFPPEIESDAAPLNRLIAHVLEAAPHTRCFRDPTRGGEDFGPIHLSDGQLAQIEEAKQKSGVNK